ncbi:hypothetical protein ABV409_11115 [Flagellimonas sp. DF-77]|uniref:hypothetical protein n=1 Tax=Flagellimonas algarum TaxID=3230298 RepID=UPI0033941DCD
MKKHLFWTLILLFLNLSCKQKKTENSNRLDVKNEFVSRIHTTDLETDLYQILGKTSYVKHVSDFENVNWKTDYSKEFRSGTYNMPDIEVLSKIDSKYLSISVAPDNHNPMLFQFIIGLGTHSETNNLKEPSRKVKIYLTESQNEEIPKKLIAQFFERDFNKINIELSKLYLLDEIEDVYINKK